MRDQHKGKDELVQEVVALRKQVSDLRDSMQVRRRVEDALRETEEMMRLLVMRAPMGVAALTAAGTPLSANPRFVSILGYQSASELLALGKVLGLFVDRDEEARALAALTGAQGMTELTMRFRAKAGSSVPLEVVGEAIRDDKGMTRWVQLFVKPGRWEELAGESAGSHDDPATRHIA